jgi:hypothetical protein
LKISEKGHDLELLGLAEYEAIEAEAVKIERKSVLDDCADCGISGLEKLTRLRQIDPWLQVRNYAASKHGSHRIIVAAAKKSGLNQEQADALANSYDIKDATNLARALVGFERRKDVQAWRELDLEHEFALLLAKAVADKAVDDDWLVAARSLLWEDTHHPNSRTSAAS